MSPLIADGTLRSETVPGLDFHHDSSDCFAGALVIFEGEDLTKTAQGWGWLVHPDASCMECLPTFGLNVW